MKVYQRTLLSFAAVAITLISAHTAAAQATVMNWTVDGEKREAKVFSPAPTTSDILHPLVFAFHGHGGNMHGFAQMVHIQTIWPEAIVVYPQGVGRPMLNDPDAMRPGWEYEANQAEGNVGNKDLDFFDAMVATMKQKFTVDDRRIYTTGFSNGAIFSYLLWAERPKVIAAVAACAGKLWDSEHLTIPRPLLAIGGQADTTLPFAVQQQTIEIARQIDNATAPGQSCGQICTFYPSTSQTPVKTYIHFGGHIYPPWAPIATVEFFKAH